MPGSGRLIQNYVLPVGVWPYGALLIELRRSSVNQYGGTFSHFFDSEQCATYDPNEHISEDCIGLPIMTAQSCKCVPGSCGPRRDCCDSPQSFGGTYYRSNDETWPASVSPFRLDNYEVTVGRFRAFVESYTIPAEGDGRNLNDKYDFGWAGAWTAKLARDSNALRSAVACDPGGLQTWTEAVGANEGKPMNCISWFEAYAFCIWDHARLPTEAEWNYVAAAGNEQRVYPWSEPPNDDFIAPEVASYSNEGGGTCIGDGRAGCTLDDLHVVGSKQEVGNHQDLAGNVAEWVLDWYHESYPTPCADCGAHPDAVARVTRGGSLLDEPTVLMTSSRAFRAPEVRSTSVGVRCARNSPP
jgi:sulfatase modifying factor 1